MPKICPQCHKTYEAGKFCLDCGVPLIDEQPLPTQNAGGGFGLHLGDANAISGGINMSDNHSVSHNTVNTSTSSVDSHNVITTNITHVEREKSKEERLQEGKNAFREACKQAFANGMCTSEEKRRLDDLRFQLGLDDETSAKILVNARLSVQRKSVVLGPIQKNTLERLKSAILNNNIEIIQRLYPQLTAMVQKFAVEELQYTYYMLQAILFPDNCVKDYESHREDKYWQTFWTSVAYRKLGDIHNSELLLADVGSKWTDAIPEENTYILAVVGNVMDDDFEAATNLYDQVTGGQSPYLESLVGCLYGILYSDMVSSGEVEQMVKDGAFYLNHLFPSVSLAKSKEKIVETKCVVDNIGGKSSEEVKISQSPSVQEPTPTKDVVYNSSKEDSVKEVVYNENVLNSYTDKYGYLRALSTSEIEELKTMLLSAPKDNYKAQFQLGQLYIQENKSATNHRLAYNAIKCASEHGIHEAGAYMAYFFLYGKVVKQDLNEAECRIKIDDDYRKNPLFVKMLVDLYTFKGNDMLADVWKSKLNILI